MCIIGILLLLFIALFHASGFNYISGLVESSKVSDLIKSIFHVLFILPTIQLIGLATFGIMALYLKEEANKILIPLAVLVLVDALLAFYLNALIPGLVLAVPAILFGIAAYQNRG